MSLQTHGGNRPGQSHARSTLQGRTAGRHCRRKVGELGFNRDTILRLTSPSAMTPTSVRTALAFLSDHDSDHACRFLRPTAATSGHARYNTYPRIPAILMPILERGT